LRCRASRPFGTIGRRRETFRSLDHALGLMVAHEGGDVTPA
jgi:hypothetical protein